MYSTKPAIVIGFHGCSMEDREMLITRRSYFKRSVQEYDWLGNGMYFWEGNHVRAMEWAREKYKRGEINSPAIVGAFIDLGKCLDLIDSAYLKILQKGYQLLLESRNSSEFDEMPRNTLRRPGDTTLKKYLDCAVIETIHSTQTINPFDSTRAVFWEGAELYEGTEFREKNHIQICVRNPNCIKGFFIPRKLDKGWKRP